MAFFNAENYMKFCNQILSLGKLNNHCTVPTGPAGGEAKEQL